MSLKNRLLKLESRSNLNNCIDIVAYTVSTITNINEAIKNPYKIKRL